MNKASVKRTLKRYLPHRVRRTYWFIRNRGLHLGDKLGLVGPDAIYSEVYYTKRTEGVWREDAKAVVDAIYSELTPESVIDLGCGAGIHLAEFQRYDTQICGVDGSKTALKNAVIPRTALELHDLRKPYLAERSYDLVLCFEALEHIPERYADTVVRSITESGRWAVVTAAPPGQGGTHHVNEQPREYWIEKFDKQGAKYDRRRTESLRKKIDVRKTTWIPENLFVFNLPKS